MACCLQAPNWKSQAITGKGIISINGGFIEKQLPGLHDSLEPLHALLKFRVNSVSYDACIPVIISKRSNPNMPTGMVYSIHRLAHVTALLTAARVVH